LKFLTSRKRHVTVKFEAGKNNIYPEQIYVKRKNFCSHLFTTKLHLVPQDGKSSACWSPF